MSKFGSIFRPYFSIKKPKFARFGLQKIETSPKSLEKAKAQNIFAFGIKYVEKSSNIV